MTPEYVCSKCELPLVRVGTNIWRHAAVMHPNHDPRFPPKTCGTKPVPIPVGVLLARKNRIAPRRVVRKPVARTIDISQYADTLLHFWASKIASGVSYRELGHAYGMNGWQMRYAVAEWKRQNQPSRGKIRG